MKMRPSNAAAFQENFGAVIRRHRLALGLSQEELAEKCELHRTYISLIERGIKSVSLKVLLALSIALMRQPHILIKEAETLDAKSVRA